MIEILNNSKYKKIYISGPITGIPNGNKFEFKKYENKLKALGFDPVNPHELHTEEEEKTNSWSDFMRTDIKALVDCDVVAVIPGWEKSKGAGVEIYIAQKLDIPIVNGDTLNQIF